MKREFDGCLVLMIVVPLVCIAGIALMISLYFWLDLNWFLAFLLALPIGFFAVVTSVALQGHDGADLVVGSLLALFFCWCLLPVFARARDNAHRQAMRKQRMEMRFKTTQKPSQVLARPKLSTQR